MQTKQLPHRPGKNSICKTLSVTRFTKCIIGYSSRIVFTNCQIQLVCNCINKTNCRVMQLLKGFHEINSKKVFEFCSASLLLLQYRLFTCLNHHSLAFMRLSVIFCTFLISLMTLCLTWSLSVWPHAHLHNVFVHFSFADVMFLPTWIENSEICNFFINLTRIPTDQPDLHQL